MELIYFILSRSLASFSMCVSEKELLINFYELFQSLVDWSKPMLSQIHKLGPYYAEWVHNPVDKELRMFESQFLESFTFTLWYFVPLFWIPIISFGTYYTYNNTVLCTGQIFCIFIIFFINSITTYHLSIKSPSFDKTILQSFNNSLNH